MDWEIIIPIVLGIVAIIFGVKWHQVAKLLKEAGEALITTSEAMEDKKITKEEVVKVLKEWADVILAGKKLVGK